MPYKLPENETVLTIGAVAKLLGVSVQTIRLYEKEGLIITYKENGSKRRLFSQNDVERIIKIREIINNEKISIAGIRTLLSLIPCWKIKQCDTDRSECPIFKGEPKPCWMIKSKFMECSNIDCRECPVYLLMSDLVNMKKLFYQ